MARLYGEEALQYARQNPQYAQAYIQGVSGSLPQAASQVGQDTSYFGDSFVGKVASGMTAPFRGLFDVNADVRKSLKETGGRLLKNISSEEKNKLDQYRQQGVLDTKGNINYDALRQDGRVNMDEVANIRRLQKSLQLFGGTAIEDQGGAGLQTEEERSRYWENPLLGGGKQAAGIAAYAVPGGGSFGGGLKGALTSGAIGGGLGGFSASKSTGLDQKLLTDTLMGAGTGAAMSGGIQQATTKGSALRQLLGGRLGRGAEQVDEVTKALGTTQDLVSEANTVQRPAMFRGQSVPNEADPVQTLKGLGILDDTGNVVTDDITSAVTGQAQANQYNQALAKMSAIKDPNQQQEAGRALLAVLPEQGTDTSADVIRTTLKSIYNIDDAGQYAFMPQAIDPELSYYQNPKTIVEKAPPKLSDEFLDVGNIEGITSQKKGLQRVGERLKEQADVQEAGLYTRNFGGKSGGGRPTTKEGGMKLIDDMREIGLLKTGKETPAEVLEKSKMIYEQQGGIIGDVADDLSDQGATVNLEKVRNNLMASRDKAVLPSTVKSYDNVLAELDSAASTFKLDPKTGEIVSGEVPLNSVYRLKQEAGRKGWEFGGKDTDVWKSLYKDLNQTMDDSLADQGFTQFRQLNKNLSIAKHAGDYAQRRLNATSAAKPISAFDVMTGAGVGFASGSPLAGLGAFAAKKALTSGPVERGIIGAMRGTGNILMGMPNVGVPMAPQIGSTVGAATQAATPAATRMLPVMAGTGAAGGFQYDESFNPYEYGFSEDIDPALAQMLYQIYMQNNYGNTEGMYNPY